jgi:succinate-acetate transporter protein
MEFLRQVLLFIHFLGLASLLGGLLVQVKGPERRILAAVLHGALTQLVSGVLLVGVLEGLDDPAHPVDNAKLGVKLVVVLIITVLAWLNRKKQAIPNGLFFTLLALTVLNVGVAVFWH